MRFGPNWKAIKATILSHHGHYPYHIAICYTLFSQPFIFFNGVPPGLPALSLSGKALELGSSIKSEKEILYYSWRFSKCLLSITFVCCLREGRGFVLMPTKIGWPADPISDICHSHT